MRARLLLLVLLALPAQAEVTVPVPRPLSPAEEAAVAVIVHYLQGGAPAVFDDLSSSSPLRALGRDAALAEIETRLGPAKGAKWGLDTVMPSYAEHSAVLSVIFPSGVDDSIRVDMEHEGAAWKLANLRTSAEPVARPMLLAAATPSTIEAAPAEVPNPLTDRRVALALSLPALVLCVGAVACGRRSQILARVLLVLAALPVIAGTAVVVKPIFDRTPAGALSIRRRSSPLWSPDAPVRLGSLLPLRKALAAGDAAPLKTGSLPSQVERDVAELWNAQMLLHEDRADEAKQILARLPKRSNIPLAELLRARVAWEKKNAIEAVESYERVMDLGPGTDTLWLEAAEALSIVGFDERSDAYMRRTAEVGSRDPALFYGMAIRSVLHSEEAKSVDYLIRAWKMRPVERANLLHFAPLWHVLSNPEVRKLLQFHVAGEPAFATTPAARPMTVAANTHSLVAGDYLRVVAGGGELHVPGGAAIAPATAQVIDVSAWRREEEQIAIDDLPRLLSDVHSGAALVQPAVRDRFAKTASALAERNRWNDIVTLTNALSPQDERVPLELTIIRGEALSRLGRADDLRRLIADLLHNPALKRKKDPPVLADIAELFAAAEDYGSAIRLLERAQRELDMPGITQRIQQLTLERELASGYSVLTTDHFDVHYPKAIDAEHAKKIGEILEAELTRLRASWFPQRQQPKRITVDVLSWEDFQGYTGSEYILGLFTNKIMLPIANVAVFPPEIVALMTHELAHALLAEATNNLAPRWFHEALASRLEMQETSRNAFRFYRDDNFLTVALLDAVADGSPDPYLVSESYQIGETTLRFIEAKYGKGAVLKMIAAFRNGATTDEAVREATGGSVADLDRLARAWGAGEPSLFTNSVVHYDIRPGKKRGTISMSEDE